MSHLSKDGRDALAEAGQKERETSGTVDPVMSDADIDALWELNDQLAVALTESWSYPDAIDADAIANLPRYDYEALIAAVVPFVKDIFFDAQPTKETIADPKAISPASNGSNTSSSGNQPEATSGSGTSTMVGATGV